MSPDGSEDDKVGYGRPPKSKQFKKGKSGNPRGRPRKPSDLIGLLDKILGDSVSIITARGKRSQISGAEAMAERLISNALKGDMGSISLVLQFALKLRDGGPMRPVIHVMNALP